MATIVVGVDGSDGAQEALRVAVQEARLRGAGLRVVIAWHMPAMAYGTVGFSPDIDPADFKDSASAALEKALAALGRQANGVQIERVTRRGQPAQVLLEEARGADMLVVGSRGHGGFVRILLGSVSHQCALHAACPVLIASGDLVLPGGDVPDAGGHQNGKAGPGDLVEPAGRSTRYLSSEAAEHGYQRGLAAGSDGGRAGTGKQAG
jgi:nucleotide-binding universal stress UspA family protein